jgi:MscS family membrane protein
VGDRISCNGVDGIVENIGLRSIRLRSLDGQQLIIPNHIIADNQLINFADRRHFRHIFNIGLVYSTTPEQMEEAVKILHEILDGRKLFPADKNPVITFNEMKDWSLNICAVVWYDTTDWGAYQADLHNVNLEILKRFNAAGLNFAFPSSTNYVVQEK